MSGGKIVKRFITDDSVDQNKIRLDNNSSMRARNNADSADVNLFKLDASDVLQLFATPELATSGTSANSLLRKEDIENLIAGLRDPKDAVNFATDAALPAYTPAGSGVGKTLTANANGELSIDGGTLSNGMRVLIKDEGNIHNGIYVVTDKGSAGTPFILTRATDADEDAEVTQGMFTWAVAGTANARTGWLLQNADPFIVDTSVAVFVETPIPEAPQSVEFDDSTFRIFDDTTPSKKIAFQASAISASTVRTISMPDTDVDLADIALNNSHRTGDGSDHQDVADLVTLSGVAANSTDLGTFTGATIPDTQTIKQALQALETSLEEIDQNANDLITLSGVAENATDLGTFTGATIPDSQTIKAALQALETAVEAAAAGGEVNTASNVGTGAGIFNQKNVYDLEFFSLLQQDGIAIEAASALDANTIFLAHLDGNSNDVSSIGAVGTWTGTETYSASDTGFGQAATGNPADNRRITYPTNAAYALTGNCTIECYYEATGIGPVTQNIMQVSDLQFQYDSPTLKAIFGGGTFTLTSTSDPRPGWHHAAVVRVGTTWTLYVDGVAEDSVVNGASFSSQALTLLDIHGGSGNVEWGGLLDEVRVSDIARYTSNFSIPSAPHVLGSDDIKIGADINGLTAKVTPVAADEFMMYDSAASALKKITFANLAASIDVGTDFIDNVFRISDDGDNSKKIAFQASAITTATVRTISMPDTDVDLADIALNNSHRTGDGSDHQDVADLATLSGVAANSTDLGTFTGATIPDTQTIKQALQALETSLEEIDQNANDLITLSGVAENATDLGTFTGATIPDSQTIKAALQALETSLEEIDQNANDLITLSGVAENATDLGIFTGTTIPDAQTIKAALQALETAVENVVADTDFADDTFRISDDVDSSKKIAFQASAIATATVRTISMPNTDVDLADIALNNSHRTGDGSDHQDVADLVTLSGVASNSTNLGIFTGVTIPDAQTIKQALQALETSLEEIDQNANDLITLSGVAENASDLGTFTGSVIPDASTIKAALQALETAVGSPQKERVVLNGTDISNGYVDMSNEIVANTMHIRGVGLASIQQTDDYTLSLAGSVTRVTWVAPLSTSLISGDILEFMYSAK